jgi:hypothetical protein
LGSFIPKLFFDYGADRRADNTTLVAESCELLRKLQYFNSASLISRAPQILVAGLAGAPDYAVSLFGSVCSRLYSRLILRCGTNY